MAKKPSNKAEAAVFIQPIRMRRLTISMCGVSPMIMHRFSQKAWRELLLPSPRKNRQELAETLKHNPVEEFRGCCYRNRNPDTPTLFHIPSGMVHKAIAQAALDIPGAAKEEIKRLVTMAGVNINFYGIPKLFAAMVRNSDQKKTPDVRIRPIFPHWALTVGFEYKADPLTDTQIFNLVNAAGQIVGFGDDRPQKGGPHGKFRIAEAGDEEFNDICKREGREAQQAAFDDPDYYDDDTAELMGWYYTELARRAKDPALEDDPNDLDQDGNGLAVDMDGDEVSA